MNKEWKQQNGMKIKWKIRKSKKSKKKNVAKKWERERDAENVSVCQEKNAHS